MQVNISGRYTDKGRQYDIPCLCGFVSNDNDAIKWALDELHHLENAHRFNVIALDVYEYNPCTGEYRHIKHIL